MQRKTKETEAKPWLELQREHHSTGILDGTDEAYSSENPPSDTYSNSRFGGKNRARLSTTHCTQQVIPEWGYDAGIQQGIARQVHLHKYWHL